VLIAHEKNIWTILARPEDFVVHKRLYNRGTYRLRGVLEKLSDLINGKFKLLLFKLNAKSLTGGLIHNLCYPGQILHAKLGKRKKRGVGFGRYVNERVGKYVLGPE